VTSNAKFAIEFLLAEGVD
jgi:hypothetical protein